MNSPTRYGGSIGGGEYTGQGMIAPLNPFVDGTGVLTPVNFRFLHSLFLCVQNLEQEVDTLKQRLATAGIP